MNNLPLQTPERRRWRTETAPPAFPPPHRMDPTAYAERLKESGNQGFKSGNFSLAIRKYDEAIQILQLYQWGKGTGFSPCLFFLCMEGHALLLLFFLTFYHTS